MSESERKDKRYAANQALLVRCESWGDFVEGYAADVSQGGMFILTPDPPPLLSFIDVKLGLPEGHEIVIRGRVVHVIDAQQAGAEGKKPGVGVEFQELEPEFKLQIHHLIEFARWEGANPNASFSKHLAEVSVSQPPARLMESLRPPGASRASMAPSSTPPSAAASATAQTYTRRKDEMTRSDASFSSSAVAMPVGDLDLDVRSGSAPAPPVVSSSAPVAASTEPGPTERLSVPGGDVGEPAADAPVRASNASQAVEAVGLKVGMTHISYKRYAQAVKAFEDMLRRHPGHREAQKWLYLAQARDYASRGKDEQAAQAYQQMLEIDESNREARKFVRDFHMEKRLNALPFGRYFVKKKS